MKMTLALAPLAAVTLLAGACSSGGGDVVQSGTTSSSGSSSASTSGGSEKVTVGVSYIPNIQFSPFYVGKDQGTFSKQGIDLTVRHHGAQEGLFTALTAGTEQYLIAGADELVQARSQGMDLVAIAPYYVTYPVVVIVPADSTIRTTADLKGKKVGVPGKYGESWFGLQVALKDGGLAEKDVDIQEIGYTQQAALKTGKVDAVIGYANNDLVQFGLAGEKVRSIPLAKDVPLVSISLVTTTKQASTHPDETKKVVEGMLGGIEAVRSDPAGAVSTSAKTIPGLESAQAQKAARATLDATLKVMNGAQGNVTGKLDPQKFQQMSAFMKETGLITKDVDPTTAVSTAYASR